MYCIWYMLIIVIAPIPLQRSWEIIYDGLASRPSFSPHHSRRLVTLSLSPPPALARRYCIEVGVARGLKR